MRNFELGKLVVTPNAAEVMANSGSSSDEVLARHAQGDWGEVSEQEREINERGLSEQFNLVSNYRMSDGQFITVFTKADRSMTMIHLRPQMPVPAHAAAGDAEHGAE
ncbi:MAG: hypothetical protein IIA67_03780 [Planctomycetes bacterium]|nr:hypothetical protein [Planctomycetota bacterium]